MLGAEVLLPWRAWMAMDACPLSGGWFALDIAAAANVHQHAVTTWAIPLTLAANGGE